MGKMLLLIERQRARLLVIVPNPFKIDGPTNFNARVSLSIVYPVKDLGMGFVIKKEKQTTSI